MSRRLMFALGTAAQQQDKARYDANESHSFLLGSRDGRRLPQTIPCSRHSHVLPPARSATLPSLHTVPDESAGTFPRCDLPIYRDRMAESLPTTDGESYFLWYSSGSRFVSLNNKDKEMKANTQETDACFWHRAKFVHLILLLFAAKKRASISLIFCVSRN